MVYYTCKVLKNAKLQYPKVEKLAIVSSIVRLMPYFQAYTIIVRTDFPLRKVSQRTKTSGRLAEWVIGLGEFDIPFEAHKPSELKY